MATFSTLTFHPLDSPSSFASLRLRCLSEKEERNDMQKLNRVVIPDAIERLATIAVDAAFAVHFECGPGLLESAYEACFAHELELRGIQFQRQIAVPLNYKGKLIEVGFRADIVMEGRLLLELKAVEQ